MDETIYNKVMDRLRVLCSRREYCTRDVLEKAAEYLSRYGCEPSGVPEAAGAILGELARDRYVDDLRYASAFARDKSSIAGWGPVKIGHALRAKGIGQDTVDAAMGEIDASRAGEKLLKLLENKKKALEGDPQSRLKLIRFALGRGYVYDEVESALKTLDASTRP